MNAGRRGLGLVRSSRWALLVLVGLGVGVGAVGHDHRWARAVAGLAVATGLGQQIVLWTITRYRKRPETFRVELPMAVALGVAIGVWAAVEHPTELPAAAALSLLLLAVVLTNRSAHETSFPLLLAAHLPGLSGQPPSANRWHAGWSALGALGLLVVSFVLAGFVRLGRLDLLVLVLAVALVALGASQRRVRAHQVAVRRALHELAPVWALPYNGIATFHLGMWVPYLQRTGRPLIVVTTLWESFRRVSAAYDLPVICAPDLGRAPLTSLFPPSVKAAFYVFNGSNRRFLDVERVRHVFLQHGDSDKAGSANPFSLRYDHIVVAGQAGIDRFAAAGLAVPPDRFVLLGRPQTAAIEQVTRPIGSVETPVVLYAPTWRGKAERTNYSSLLLGPRIVRILLSLGVVVVFRAHPAGRNFAPHVRAIKRVRAILEADAAITGRPHRWGPAAEGVSVAEVANLSDAMIADVSGIVTDYLASGKPFAMVATRNSAEDFRQLFPTSQAAYVIESDLSGIKETLQQMLGPDPMAQRRAERRAYYLSDRSGQEAADAFVAWVASLDAPEVRRSARAERRPDAVQGALQHG